MFGYVRPYLEALTEQERARYNAVYCGLCRTLGRRHGVMGKLSLTFDMTFLTLLLQSLYEPEEHTEHNRCAAHPAKPHDETMSAVSEYCADMTVALMYHKFLDDWQDEHKLLKKGAANIIEKDYQQVRGAWPEQCAAIEQCLDELAAIEREPEPRPDAAADSFGRLMGALMLWKHDFWSGALTVFGRSLGRFVYMMDAAVDYDGDRKKHRYNPISALDIGPESARPLLEQTLGDAAQVLEELPLVQDIDILRNTLYSGVWQVYNKKMQKEGDKHGEGSV